VLQNAAVSHKGLRNRNSVKKTQIKYVTADISTESVNRIRKLQNTGRGKVLIIIGNGPSVNEIELQELKNRPNIDTLSINRPHEKIWPTTYWAFFDGSQIRRHRSLWDSYGGIVLNSTSIKPQNSKSMQFKNIGGIGFSRDVSKGIYIGRSSVFAAMQIALWMNYDRVFILGCDMNPIGVDGKLHFYGDNPDVDPEVRAYRFKEEASHYDKAASILTPEERSKFFFCSDYNPWGFINEFGSISHKLVVTSILQSS
jgi:hypothetical protein